MVVLKVLVRQAERRRRVGRPGRKDARPDQKDAKERKVG
jgi:hypothetical protein